MAIDKEVSHLAEQMAIAVLRGDYVAARGLADLLQEESRSEEGRLLVPIKRLEIKSKRFKILVYLDDRYFEADDETREWIEKVVQQWLASERNEAMLLVGVIKIEIYEIG